MLLRCSPCIGWSRFPPGSLVEMGALQPEPIGSSRCVKEEGLGMSTLVMVIDDSPTVRKLLEVSLRRAEIDVVSYPDGIEALRAVSLGQLDRLPDLLFLDLELPRMNGFEVARLLRANPQWNGTVIVMLSRYDGIIHRLKARLAGTQAYLTKPFTTHTIVDVVNTCLERAQPTCAQR